MNANFFRNIIFGTVCLMFIIFSGCAPEENDLVPPNAAIDSGVVDSPTASTTATITGTMDLGSTVEIDVTTSAIITGLTQDPTVGTWLFTISGMVEGENIILVSVADAVGNTRTIQLTIVVDLTGPSITFDQYVTPTPHVNQMLAGTVSEIAAGVEFCVEDGISICDPLVSLDWTTVADVNGMIWQHPLVLPGNGDYDILVRGFDTLDNLTAEANYAIERVTVDSLTPAPDFSIDQAIPFYLPDPINVADDSLSGMRQDTYDLTLSNSPAVIYTLDSITDTTSWTLDYTGLVSGNTVATFTVDDGTGTDTAESRVLIVRDLIGPQLIDRVPLPGVTTVPTTSDLVLTFSETMDPATIDGTLITLEDDADPPNVVTVTVNLPSADDRTFTFTPDILLSSESTKYNVTINNTDILTATDQYGNAFIPPAVIWTFTTAP